MKTFVFGLFSVLLSFSVYAEKSDLFFSVGGVSYHHQHIEGVEFNESHPGIGIEVIGTPFQSVSQLKYSVFGHYMLKDSFNAPAYWVGLAGFYRFEPIKTWEIDLGLGAMYLNKSLAKWSSNEVAGIRSISLIENNQILPIPYIGVNKRFDEGRWISKVGFNLIHAPRISGRNEVSVTYIQAKLSF